MLFKNNKKAEYGLFEALHMWDCWHLLYVNFWFFSTFPLTTFCFFFSNKKWPCFLCKKRLPNFLLFSNKVIFSFFVTEKFIFIYCVDNLVFIPVLTSWQNILFIKHHYSLKKHHKNVEMDDLNFSNFKFSVSLRL